MQPHPEPDNQDNADSQTVAGFGDEWTRFDQSALSERAREQIFTDYFSIFPLDRLTQDFCGADIGCGSGRWASVVAPRVGSLCLVDASPDALKVAQRNLSQQKNVTFELASVGNLPQADGSLDFAYSLGVLHHVPDTQAAIKAVSRKLKQGAPFLIYLYYAFDNRGPAFRALWRISDVVRQIISRLPHGPRYVCSQLIALSVYWPLARAAAFLNKIDALPSNWPLAYYSDKPFYVMRTDALDRFGTRLEQRFSREQIEKMLTEAGFTAIKFSERAPYWCAVGVKG